MKQYTFYKIANIIIRVKFDFVFYTEISYMKQFIIPEQNEYDFEIDFEQIKDITPFCNKATMYMKSLAMMHYYQDDKGKEYCFFEYNKYLHAVTYIESKTLKCRYISQQWLKEITASGFDLENFFGLENVLINFQSLILHSCYIQKKGKGILFSAPSGTGKSTQGELWREYQGAEVINGDRTIIRYEDKRWNAYSAPVCGTSGICLNKKNPLGAIVVLRQSPVNRIRMLNGKEAFMCIYSELTIHGWNRQYVNMAIDCLNKLLNDIPIILFEATKDIEAVEKLYTFFIENEIL